MADFESLLNRWQSAGVLDAASSDRIRAWEAEQEKPAGLRWQGLAAVILGAILLACGVVLLVSARWDEIPPGARFAVVLGMVAVFHLGASWARKNFRPLSSALHAVGTVSTGVAIALAGQVFNIQDHWPAAVLLWALAALVGWILLHDEAQKTLTLLLVPAWMFSELAFHAQDHIGANVFAGRFLLVWAVLDLTFFLDSKQKVLQGVLFAVSVVAALSGVLLMLGGWVAWSSQQTFLSLWTWWLGWAAIAALPLFFFRFRKSLLPVVVALVFSIALPWCHHNWIEYGHNGAGFKYPLYRTTPNLAAHALVAAFAVFIIWWGVRLLSRALVNLGILWFAVAVAWFYFSDLIGKMGRSLGLIGLGVLFLAGGWALEKMRRRLLGRMGRSGVSEEVQ
jgi:peptidoglycan/LPS O-acetylase OafA/YrhL